MAEITSKLLWSRSTKGYEIVEINPTRVDWNRVDVDGSPPARELAMGLSESALRAIDRWGPWIRPTGFDDEPDRAIRLLEPVPGTTTKILPLERDPDLYVAFSNIRESEPEILKFASTAGVLDDGPQYIEVWQREAAIMAEAIESFRQKNIGRFREILNKRLDPESSAVGLGVDEIGRLEIRAPNLIAGMWMQLGSRATGTTFTQCRTCGRLIAHASGASRSDRIYCSDACRVRAHRKSVRQPLPLGRKRRGRMTK